eukprot:807667_1
MAMKSLTDNDLKELGITRMAHRKMILQQLKNNEEQLVSMNEGYYTENNTENIPTDNGENETDSEDIQNEELFAQQHVTTGADAIATHNSDVNNNEDEYE